MKEAEQRRQEMSAAMQSSKSKRRGGHGEDDIDMLEALPPGQTSKEIKKSMAELEHQSAAELRERLSCICCFERPRQMLIMTCKHIPFCKECELDWRLKAGDPDTLACPMCRTKYKKTVQV